MGPQLGRYGRWLLAVLGVGYTSFALAWSIWRIEAGTGLSGVVFVSGTVGVSGVTLVALAWSLPRVSIAPRFYGTTFWWTLAGIGVMSGILALYHVQPDTGLSEPYRSIPLLTGLSAVAGAGVGLYAAKARTTAARLERQKAHLERVSAELEASNQRLEQFASVASHDLNEPLRMITNYLELLDRRYGEDLDEEAHEYLAFATDGAERMRDMIDGLLAFSRVDTEASDDEPVDLEAVLTDVRTDMALHLEETDADLTIGELPTVHGDPDQLGQLFRNLLTNAVTYSGEEPPVVSVTAERNGDEWLVSVTDEGIGIDSTDQERIFELFERLHTREEYEGTGIGLALSRRVARRHGGDIEVDSTLGEGTTFTVRLPTLGSMSTAGTERG